MKPQEECINLWFHTIVLLSNEGIDIKEVIKELESRFGKSGILEKASREVSEEEK